VGLHDGNSKKETEAYLQGREKIAQLGANDQKG